MSWIIQTLIASYKPAPTWGTISFDASTSWGYNASTGSRSFSHTCSGTNRILFFGWYTQNDTLTWVTYAGVPMTFAWKVQVSWGQWVYVYYLINPATGSNSISVTAPSSWQNWYWAVSYSSTAPITYGSSATDTGSVSSWSPSFAISLSSSTTGWVTWVWRVADSDGNLDSISPWIFRINNTWSYHTLWDSNGAMASGTKTITIQNAQTGNIAWIISEFY